MSDAENRKAINTNTKSIKELTKKFAEFAGSKGKDSKEDKEEKELTGIKAVDNKIEDIKEAFSNNTTIKFFKDPAGTIGGGLQSAFEPILSIPDNIGKSFKKIGGFFSKTIFDKDKKGTDNKILKGIEKNTKATVKSLEVFSTIEGRRERAITEAIGEGALADELQTEEMKKMRQPLTNLTLLTKQSADALKSGFLRITKADKLIEKARNFLFGQSLSNEEKALQYQENLQDTTHSGFDELINLFDAIRDKIVGGVKGAASAVQAGATVINPVRIGRETAKALEKSQGKQDQKQAEATRDNKLFQTNLFEKLTGGLLGGLKMLSLSNIKEAGGKITGGLIGFIKRNILGIGAGAAVAGGKVGLGIAGFFKGIGSGFMYLGANLPMFAKGAAAMALIGLSFIPFGGALMLINKALEGMTFKKIGMFATMLGILGGAIAAFGLVMSTGVGAAVIMLGIAALAAAGTALIPFGYAMKLAGSGLESAAKLFSELGEVGWDKVGKAGDAIKDLAVAFRDLSFGGLIDKITGGGFRGFVKDLADFGGKATAIGALSDAMEKLAKVVTPFQNMTFTTNIGEMLKDITKYGEKLDGGFFGVNAQKATDGLGLFLGKLTEHLNYNENRGPLMDSMTRLLETSMGAATFFAQSGNQTAAFTGQIDPALTTAMQQPVIINQGGSADTTNVNRVVRHDSHLNDRTLAYVASLNLQQ